jgi:hypothetical protein
MIVQCARKCLLPVARITPVPFAAATWDRGASNAASALLPSSKIDDKLRLIRHPEPLTLLWITLGMTGITPY